MRDGLEIARQAFDFPIAIAHRIRPAATIYLFLRAERGGGLSARGAALLCFSQGTFCRLAAYTVLADGWPHLGVKIP